MFISNSQPPPRTQPTTDDAEAVPSLEDRIFDYMSEIRLTTRQLNIAEMEERDLMRRIIEVWNRIKRLRSEQLYTNTAVKLTVQTEEVCKDVVYVMFIIVGVKKERCFILLPELNFCVLGLHKHLSDFYSFIAFGCGYLTPVFVNFFVRVC